MKGRKLSYPLLVDNSILKQLMNSKQSINNEFIKFILMKIILERNTSNVLLTDKQIHNVINQCNKYFKYTPSLYLLKKESESFTDYFYVARGDRHSWKNCRKKVL